MTVTTSSLTSYSAKELGLSGEKPGAIGQAIEDNEEIAKRLAPYLGIKQWQVYEPHVVEEPKKKAPAKKKKEETEEEEVGL